MNNKKHIDRNNKSKALPERLGLKISRKLFTLALVLVGVVLIGTAVLIVPRGADAQSGGGNDADYTNVRSALGGVTNILRQDDLVVNMGGINTAVGPDYYASSLSAITTANSNGTQNFDGFEIPGTCDSCSYDTLYHTQDKTVVTGRFFHTLQDSVVSYPSRRNSQDLVDIMTGTRNGNGNASFYWNTSQQLPYGTNSTTVSQGYVADFNGDGYDDLLMVYSDKTLNQAGNARARIATANNVDDPSQGLNFGTQQLFGLSEAIRATAVGDFNGDGQPDIANLRVQDDLDLWLAIYTVDPKTLTISYQQEVVVETLPDLNVTQFQLVAGKFTGSANQQLVVAHESGTNKNIKLRLFDFADGSYNPVLKQTYDSGTTATNIKVLTSRFDWSSPYDAIAFMQTTVNAQHSKSSVYLVTVDPITYAMTLSSTFEPKTARPPFDDTIVALDIAVGNFNNQKPNPTDPNLKITDPDLQLAVASAIVQSTNTDNKPNLLFGAVNPLQVIDQSSGKISFKLLGNIFLFQDGGNEQTLFQNLSINSADLEGRSMRLGNGYKIAIDKTSPKLILAQPPLHVDWAPLNLSNINPTVMNLSFATDRFNATFTTTSSTNNTSNTSKTTGWGFSGKESLDGSLTVGKTDAAGNLQNGYKLSETFTAQQDLNHSTEATNGTSVTTSQTIAQTTGSNDVVWYQDGITYLYAYEVIAQKICPAALPNCEESQKVPLTVMMSAPGPTTTQYVSAEALEWYQPVWENGNVLSYPANNGQLLKDRDSQTSVFGSATQRTDTSNTSFTTTWAGTQNQEQNIGFSQVFQEDSDTNIEYANGVSILGTGFGVSVDANLNFDFGGSDSLSTMRTSSSTIEQSKGMTINKNVNFLDSNTYGYNFSGVIFGKTAPLSYFDGTDPNTPGSGLPPVNNDLNIFGPMRSAFTVDPLADGQGGWWSHSYGTAPDVALNHPNRWSQVKGSQNSPLPSNCLDTNDGYADCTYQKMRQPSDPWDDAFHAMRGFFIFKAGEADPNNPYNQGLQQQAATAGDQMSLQARVYNYSLKTMPAGTQVKVRFYGMPWDTTTQLPADYVDQNNPGGASFLIGETTLSPIPAWNNGTDTPNYSIASVNFDTTGHDDQDLVFWVAVWMQDSNGNLIGELPGKGLTALPTSLSSPSFFQMTGLEPTTTNNWKESDTDPDTTSFSNNIGFYKQAFYIAPGNTQAAQVAAKDYVPAIQASLDAVSVKDIDVNKPSIRLGQSTEVHVTLHNKAEENLGGASVYFYDGNPAMGGQLFDIDRLAHIRAGADHKVRVRFSPKECGMHDIFVRVVKSGISGTTGSAATQLRVGCTIPPLGNYRPPQLSVTLNSDSLSSLKARMIPVTAQIVTFDKNDPRPDVRLESITHNQADDAKDDVAEAEFGTDDRTFLLRPGQGLQPRVYEVVYSATNWMGRKTYSKAYITLGPNQGR